MWTLLFLSFNAITLFLLFNKSYKWPEEISKKEIENEYFSLLKISKNDKIDKFCICVIVYFFPLPDNFFI